MTAVLASGVIFLFQDTLDQVVYLAVLMPIVANMGGVAGTQTLTLVIRSLALGHISESNSRWLLVREPWRGRLERGRMGDRYRSHHVRLVRRLTTKLSYSCSHDDQSRGGSSGRSLSSTISKSH